MSDDSIKEQIESGEADPSDFINTRSEARRSRRQTDQVSQSDLEQGRVDPTDLLDGTATVAGEAEQTLHVKAEQLKDEQVRSSYAPHVGSRGVVVHLSGDNEVDAVAKKWANETGATVTS